MKKVLLTGAAGLIGRQAIPELLQKNYEVHAVYHQSANLPYEDMVYWHKCDLLNSDMQKKLLATVAPSHLLHLAWYTEHGKYWSARENLCWVQASLNLLVNFTQNNGRRVVFCGSCAEYDWSYGFCSEQVTPTKPATLYGCCKNSLQEMLARYSAENALSTAWGRVFFFYGPHEPPCRLVSSVISALMQGRQANCTHGNQIRDFLYVKDVADALVTLLDCKVEGPVNIASGQPIYLREIIMKIAEKLGKADGINFGVIPTGPHDPPLVVADTRRLSREVAWHPSYNLDTGLEETISWWKQYLVEAIPGEEERR